MTSKPLIIFSCVTLSLLSLCALGDGAASGSVEAGRAAPGADVSRTRGPHRAPTVDRPREADSSWRQYADLIHRIATEEGVDPDLVRAIIRVESNFEASAVSPKGARGLMQLIRGTASRYAVADPFDPEANIRGGVRYLRFLQELFPGRLPWALAAYNAGENAVLRHNGVPPYRETRQYVDRVLAHYGRRDLDANSLAIQGPHPPAAPEEAQGSPSAQMIFRVEDNEVVLYTNVSPAHRHAPRPSQ
ncbi:MAG TPA: lytic transglycosylase domain-containing protein [Candidatus Methylomirabilis sp.]|nr:lytic transglycosylase domain-containing protein [Candidatus Methylomirabilis sp.]